MPDFYTTITTDQKPELVDLIRRLPSMLAGKTRDVGGIAAGFRARLGYAVLSLIAPNFNDLGRGMPGVDGTKWPPLTKAYLAYGRRFGKDEQKDLQTAYGIPRGANKAPGNKKGLLTPSQVQLWRRTYADRLAWYIMREPDDKARAHAAAVAWIVVKQAGGQTKLEVYGNRTVQMLVDTGYLRGSLQPGVIAENGPYAEYIPPSGSGSGDQVFEIQSGYQVVVGTSVQYADYHHAAKDPKRRRRLWPATFPSEWWRQILGIAVSGLHRLGELYRAGN